VAAANAALASLISVMDSRAPGSMPQRATNASLAGDTNGFVFVDPVREMGVQFQSGTTCSNIMVLESNGYVC
jgi:hypothetical protein